MILLIFVKKWRQNDLGISDRLLGYYPISISSQHLKTVWRRLLTAVRCEWWNGATGFAIPFSVSDPLPTSAFGKPRSTTDAWCSSGNSDDFFNFFLFFFFTFLFNQEDKSMLITVRVVRRHSHNYFSLIHKWYISSFRTLNRWASGAWSGFYSIKNKCKILWKM